MTFSAATKLLFLQIVSFYYHVFSSNIMNIGSSKISASTYIFAKLKTHTYTLNSLPFPAEMNTDDSKTPRTFVPFYTIMITEADY